MGEAGVPVAGPARYEPDPSFLGAAVRRHAVRGRAGPRRLHRGRPVAGRVCPATSDRAAVWRSFLDVLPAVHRAGGAGLGLRRGLGEELSWWERYVLWATDGAPPPDLAGALVWCSDHRPAEEPPGGLLWGDVRLGNVVFDPERRAPRAVLDWDMASVGPAEMDLAWFLALEAVQEGLSGMRVPGFGSRDEAVAGWRPASVAPSPTSAGTRPSPSCGPARCRPASPCCSTAPAGGRCSRPGTTRRWPPRSPASAPGDDRLAVALDGLHRVGERVTRQGDLHPCDPQRRQVVEAGEVGVGVEVVGRRGCRPRGWRR